MVLLVPSGQDHSAVSGTWHSILPLRQLPYATVFQGHRSSAGLCGWHLSTSFMVPWVGGSFAATQTGPSLVCGGQAFWQHAPAIQTCAWQSWYPLFPGILTGHASALKWCVASIVGFWLPPKWCRYNGGEMHWAYLGFCALGSSTSIHRGVQASHRLGTLFSWWCWREHDLWTQHGVGL